MNRVRISCSLSSFLFTSIAITHLWFYTADNQILYINIKNFGYIIKSFKVWLNGVTTPFTYSTIRFSNLFCKPFPCFLLFDKHNL